MSAIVVDVPLGELLTVLPTVARFTTPDESDREGGVTLDLTTDGRRRWTAGQDRMMVRMVGGHHTGEAFGPVTFATRVLPAGSLLAAIAEQQGHDIPVEFETRPTITAA